MESYDQISIFGHMKLRLNHDIWGTWEVERNRYSTIHKWNLTELLQVCVSGYFTAVNWLHIIAFSFHHRSFKLTFVLGFWISCITEAVPYLRESFLQWFIQNMCQINHHGTRHCWISGTNKVILPVVLGVIMTCQNKIAPCIRV